MHPPVNVLGRIIHHESHIFHNFFLHNHLIKIIYAVHVKYMLIVASGDIVFSLDMRTMVKERRILRIVCISFPGRYMPVPNPAATEAVCMYTQTPPQLNSAENRIKRSERFVIPFNAMHPPDNSKIPVRITESMSCCGCMKEKSIESSTLNKMIHPQTEVVTLRPWRKACMIVTFVKLICLLCVVRTLGRIIPVSSAENI